MAPNYSKLDKNKINDPNNILNKYTEYELIIFQKDFDKFDKFTKKKFKVNYKSYNLMIHMILSHYDKNIYKKDHNINLYNNIIQIPSEKYFWNYAQTPLFYKQILDISNDWFILNQNINNLYIK